MPAGRPPKSVEQKRAEGTLRPRDKQTPVLIGGRGIPEPSDYLNEGQRECFDEIVSVLKDANILDLADAGMIELAAIERANVIACNLVLNAPDDGPEDRRTNGLIIMGSMGGPIANPAVAMRAKSLNHLRQLYNELGIGPAARARMQNLGVSAGKTPAQALPGVGAKPTPLRAVANE
jgi:P27 family predicted phage terminase small subunit